MAPQAAETLSPHDCFLKPASDSIAVHTDLPKSLHPCSSGRAWVLKLLASCNYTRLQPFPVIMPTPSCSLQEARDVMAARSLDCQCCSSRVMYVMAYAVGDWKPLGASLFPMRCVSELPEGLLCHFSATMWMRGLSDVTSGVSARSQKIHKLADCQKNESHLPWGVSAVYREFDKLFVAITRNMLCFIHSTSLRNWNEYLWEECVKRKISLLWSHSGETLISRWSFIVSNYCAISWMGFVRAGHSGG